MKYIFSNDSLILFLNGKPVKVSKESPVYASIIKAFRLPEDQQEAAILAALDKQNVNKNIEAKGFIINGDEVIFEGEKLPAPLAQKILSLMKENLPVELFKNFWRNLKKNPSRTSILELYDFLAYRELPISEDGCFIAYRGLRNDFYSRNGNPETKVIKGKVNALGQIYNGVGEEIEIERSSCDDSRINCASFGCHAGSYEYARGWSVGKLVAVKINPKDVVSVPTDCECQKLRCCAYTVISEIEEEIVAPVVNKKNQPVENKAFKKDQTEQNYIQKRVKNYLEKISKETNEYGEEYEAVSIPKIRNIFSPKYPDKKEIISAAQSLGYRWGYDLAGTEVIFLD